MKEFWNSIQFVFTVIGGWLTLLTLERECFV